MNNLLGWHVVGWRNFLPNYFEGKFCPLWWCYLVLWLVASLDDFFPFPENKRKLVHFDLISNYLKILSIFVRQNTIMLMVMVNAWYWRILEMITTITRLYWKSGNIVTLVIMIWEVWFRWWDNNGGDMLWLCCK